LRPFARALELKTLCDFYALKGTDLTRRPTRQHPPLTRPTCFASWPLSRVGNPRGLRDALAATRRDALDVTRTDRATAHGPSAADQTVALATRPAPACWLVSRGAFTSFPTLVAKLGQTSLTES